MISEIILINNTASGNTRENLLVHTCTSILFLYPKKNHFSLFLTLTYMLEEKGIWG